MPACRIVGSIGLAGLVVLSGCAINPNTGRNQLMAFPAAQSIHANMGFAIASAAQGMGSATYCRQVNRADASAGAAALPCPSAASLARLSQQVERIGAELATEAGVLAPDLYARIGAFQISVESNTGAGTSSSAGGRIAIDAWLAAADPTDDVVAFLIAREMGHVIARHGEEDSGARLAFSVLTTVVPMGGLIVRFAASMLGSQALKASWAEGQRREADELALALLERSNRPSHVIALNLRVGLARDRLPAGEWGAWFAQSIDRVEAIAFARHRSISTQLAAVSPRNSFYGMAIEGAQLPADVLQ